MSINKECEHQVVVCVRDGMIVSYCSKCGKILNSKPIDHQDHRKTDTNKTLVDYSEGTILHDNGGEILND
jgi:hypothetical protein